MSLFKDKNKRHLLVLGIFVFLILMLSTERFPLLGVLELTLSVNLLTSGKYIAVFENLLIRFLAAYAFYILNSYLPRQKQKSDTLKLLNSCIASIIVTNYFIVG